MMAVNCPFGCGKRFTTNEFSEIHADETHPNWRTPRRKGWMTPYGFGDWREPVTYQEACDEMKKVSQMFSDMHPLRSPDYDTR